MKTMFSVTIGKLTTESMDLSEVEPKYLGRKLDAVQLLNPSTDGFKDAIKDTEVTREDGTKEKELGILSTFALLQGIDNDSRVTFWTLDDNGEVTQKFSWSYGSLIKASEIASDFTWTVKAERGRKAGNTKPAPATPFGLKFAPATPAPEAPAPAPTPDAPAPASKKGKK